MLSLVLVKQFNDIIWLFSFYRFGLTSLTNVHISKYLGFMPLVSEQSPIVFIFNCILDLLNVNQDNDILKFEINKTTKSKSLTPLF